MITVIFGTCAQATAVTILAPSLAMPPASYCCPTMKPTMFCRNSKRDAALAAQLDEVRGLERALGIENAVVAEDADRNAVQVGEAGHQGGAVELLELVELGGIDQPRDHLAHVVLLLEVGRHDAVELGGVVGRLARLQQRNVDGSSWCSGWRRCAGRSPAHGGRRPHNGRQRRSARMHVGAAQLLRRNHLPGRRLHQRRTAEEDGALIAHDHRLVGHRRHIGAAGGA